MELVGNSDYTLSNDKLIVMVFEAPVRKRTLPNLRYSRALHLEGHIKTSRQSIFQPRFEPGISRLQTKIVTAWVNLDVWRRVICYPVTNVLEEHSSSATRIRSLKRWYHFTRLHGVKSQNPVIVRLSASRADCRGLSVTQLFVGMSLCPLK